MATTIRSTLPQLNVKVNGNPLPADAFHDILEGVVESSLHLPDACTLRIHDNAFKWLDSNHWKEGNQILIEAGQGQDQLIKVFEGEVTTLELDLAAMGVAMLTVRCMDKAHQLHRGKKRRTFLKVKDSDMVRQIATDCGLRVGKTVPDTTYVGNRRGVQTVDETDVIHDWVIQNNQTDWEFLQFLAQRNGYRLYLEGKDQLCFKKVSEDSPAEIELEWGKDLRSFRLRVSSSNQVSKVIVRSWDPVKKQPIVGQADVARGGPKIGERSDGKSTSQQAFGRAEMVVVDRPVRSQKEAEHMAQSVCDEIGASFIEADGLCYNKPQLRPGDKVKLSNIGNRFNGQYIVTSTTHTFSAAEGFSTQFVISGKQPATLLSILGGGGGGGGSKSESKGSPNAGSIVIGVVTDNMDPQNRGRVKVKFPALSEELATDWIRIATPMGGPDRGFMFLPEVNDEVLVAFENGDVHQGYIIGCLWNGVDKSPMPNNKAVASSKVRHRRIKSRYGHIIDMDDDGRLVVQTPKGQRMVLTDDGNTVAVKTNKGFEFQASEENNQIAMWTPMGFAIGINEQEKFLTMHDPMGNAVEINSMSGTVSVTAMTMVNVKGNGPVNISGAMVNINTGPAPGASKKVKKDSGKTGEVENK